MSWMSPYEQQTGERFEKDVADHEMTVLHADDMYRHLRFARPVHSSYWFELVTWPGALVIRGDMGSFTFSRMTDMFEFFRHPHGGWHRHDSINPSYWAEKTPDRTVTEEYSEDKFRRVVSNHVAEFEAEYPGLAKAVEAEIFDSYGSDITYEDSARRALRDFVYYPGAGADGGLTFEFQNVGELDFTEWSYRYLWCCNAIQWGITQYDLARRAETSEAAAVTA